MEKTSRPESRVRMIGLKSERIIGGNGALREICLIYYNYKGWRERGFIIYLKIQDNLIVVWFSKTIVRTNKIKWQKEIEPGEKGECADKEAAIRHV